MDPSPESLLLVVGQLLEATKAATEGIKGLSAEVRQNATAIITAAKTLEMIEETVSKLNDIVLSDPTSLTRQTDNHTRSLTSLAEANVELKRAHDELEGAFDALIDRVDGLDKHNDRLWTAGNIFWYAVVAVAWIITTGIALYGALKGN